MEKLANALLSMRAMALGMFVFLSGIAIATFIESDQGIQAAKLWIYNALWFEILMVFLTINMVSNIFRHRMWSREKIAMLLFHLSFIVIMIGAAVTRYISFEGTMPIREGETSNILYSADPYLWVRINDGKMQATNDTKAFLAESYPFNNTDLELWLPKHPNNIRIEYVDFKSKHIDTLKIDPKFKTSALDIVTDGMTSNFVVDNEIAAIGGIQVAFSEKEKVIGVNVYRKNGQLMIRPSMPMQFIPMNKMKEARETGQTPPDSVYVRVAAGEEVPFATTTLYQLAGSQFVFKQEIKNAGKELVPSGRRDVGLDYLTVKITDGTKSKIVTLPGGMREIPQPTFFEFNGLNYHMEYGSKRIELPFGMKCIDFMLDRYPGSDMASSYASILQIVDEKRKVFTQKRVFMNHVLDYDGYRFFQSAYDQDEKGTILSVNHDWWGTNITYLGYLMMTIGMIMNLFAPVSRFREMLSKLNKSSKTVAVVAFTALASLSYAQDSTAHDHAGHDHAAHDHTGHDHTDHDHAAHDHAHEEPQTQPAASATPIVRFISEEHSDKLAHLLVQDFKGRIVPMHTVCREILIKLYRGSTYEDRNAVQTVLSMHMYPEYWLDQKVIYVHTAVRENLKLNKYVSFKEIASNTGEFKWMDAYNAALRKAESRQSEYEKKLIKLGEKFQVLLSVVNWEYMKIIPLKGDRGNRWFMPFNPELRATDTITSTLAIRYISSLNESAMNPGNYANSEKLLTALMKMQRSISPAHILPTETHVQVEISYNKMGIFRNAEYSYLLFGLILMITFFIKVLKTATVRSELIFKRIRQVVSSLFVLIFLYHGTGLGMRWYVSGHAPWSDGYEAVVFIAWVTAGAGLIFSRKNPGILAGAALLAAFMIMVTELNLLDPEITPLQPVLKSYWLMIHVAIITGSYGFLGLSCILGLFNLVLFVFRSPRNGEKVTRNINELTYVSEMTMTIGLFMLTIGTFLGGIWANESWGRYWGWDPKETWALVSVLVYAIIMHFRYIPGLKGNLAFNIAGFWGYAAIIFTFFGVNFILVGLHSYANGDGAVNLPSYVYVLVLIFLILTVFAIRRNKKYSKDLRNSL